MNRKLLLAVAVAAVAALLAGAAVGRDLLSSAAPVQRPDVVRFKDDTAKVSIAYPATWTRLPQPAGDEQVSLLIQSGTSASLLMRISGSGIAPFTKKQLPIVRSFTDGLVGSDPRTKELVAPQPVQLGGLLGYRYRYTYGTGSTAGAHDHYFLFKGKLLIQLVFQAVPATKLPALTSVFQRIAGTFKGNDA